MKRSGQVRIIYFIGQLGLGGSERQLYLLLKHLDGKKFDRHVVVFNPSANYTLDEDLRHAGVQVHTLPLKYKGIIARLTWLYFLIIKIRPYILHSWTIHDNAYAGVLGRLAFIPNYFGSVRDSVTTAHFSSLPRYLRWFVLHSVQGLVVNSEQIVGELRAMGVSPKKIYLLPNCVELHDLEALELPAIIPSGKRIVGMVANLSPKKNHMLFIRALAALLEDFPDVIGVMIGQVIKYPDVDMLKIINDEIKKLNAGDKIIFAGFHPQPPMLLKHFEIFCMPSSYEGTPNAILEAMAAGLPVVASWVGGIPQIVEDARTGILFTSNHEAGLSSALRTLLDDPTLAKQMGAAGRDKVEREFGCAVIVRALEAYYQTWIDVHG